ncbi:hypothetical protein V6Z12_A09G166200 [Gossypium hirsutum]
MTFLLPFPLPLGLQLSAIDNSLVKDLFQFLLHPVPFFIQES